MKTEWDYTNLASAYLKRPDYASSVIDSIFDIANLSSGMSACDVGAGVAHLTLELAQRHLNVTSVEPNDEMRRLGKKRTESLENVKWFEGTGENTGMADGQYEIVTFGSSFNVCDRTKALAESKRILKPKGWIALMWNHRDLDDEIQSRIESIIASHVPSYGYGTRREDQQVFLEQSGVFNQVIPMQGKIVHNQSIDDVIEAWRSHATLHRQAGDKFEFIIEEIKDMLCALKQESIDIPYTTRAWLARLN